MRRCALVALGLVLAGSSVFTATASAGGSRDHGPLVGQIIRDCARDGDLDRTYPLRALRRALAELPWHIRRHTRCERKLEHAIDRAKRRLDREVGKIGGIAAATTTSTATTASAPSDGRCGDPTDLRDYTDCEGAIRRAIRRAERPLNREVFRIWRDCARDDDLDRHYSLRALRRALRRLPDDLRDYTDCERAIKRAIRRGEKDRDPHHGHGKPRGYLRAF